MKSELIAALEPLGYPVFLQGSLNADEDYPESFFTFWNFDTPEVFYNNKPINAAWSYWVNFFSSNPRLVESVTNQAIAIFRSKGWILKGRGEDAPSDEKTHTGRRLTLYVIENYNEEENDG